MKWDHSNFKKNFIGEISENYRRNILFQGHEYSIFIMDNKKPIGDY